MSKSADLALAVQMSKDQSRIAELENALRNIIGLAGRPNRSEACRLIIRRAEEALAGKTER